MRGVDDHVAGRYFRRLQITTMNSHLINLNINKNLHISIHENEIWYFKHMLDEIKNYFKADRNKVILMKFPGTERFYYVDYYHYKKIEAIVTDKINEYNRNYLFSIGNQ